MGLLELSITQLKLLHQLELAGRELTLKEAAERVLLSFPAASRTVDDLVRRGIVERHEDVEDRRMKRVGLTAQGRRVIRTVNEARLNGLEQFTKTLNDDERVLGGFLTQSVSWRAIFFINPPIAAITIAVTLFAARETRDETVSRSVDYAGIAAITVGLTSIVLALVEGNAWHWGSVRVVSLLVVAVAALVAFVVIEMRVRAPMVDFTFFRSRSFLGASVVGPRPLMTAGLLVVAAALLIQSRLTVHSGYGLLLPGFVLMGIGMGLVMSPMSTAAMNAVDRTKAGVASGVLSMSRMVGGTFGVAVMGALVATIGRSNLDSSLPHLPAATRAAIASSLGGGGTAAGQATPQIVAAVRQAFVSALGIGLTVGGIVTVIGAGLAFTLVQRAGRRHADAVAEAPSDPQTASVGAGADAEAETENAAELTLV